MMKTGGKHAALCVAAVLGALLSVPRSGWALAAGPAAGTDSGTANSASQALNKKQFHDVHVTVQGGIATLTGQVSVYADKAAAEKRVRHVPGVTAVRDQIQVAGPQMDDAALQAKLLKSLAVDRVGYHVMFNAIGVQVNDGVATLVGHARDYQAANSAVALVSSTPGVKGVVNHISVDPASPADDAIRVETARAIYGYPPLYRYAMNPAKPIRISVQMGHVELYGEVASKADKEMAYMRARSVPGVFSVQNDLNVAGQQGEQPR